MARRYAFDRRLHSFPASADAAAVERYRRRIDTLMTSAECVPALSKEQLYWRLDFLGGALTYAMADFGLIKRPQGVSEAAHRQHAAQELIRFSAAGFKA